MENTLSLSGHGGSGKQFPSSNVFLTLRYWSESPHRRMADKTVVMVEDKKRALESCVLK